MISHLTTADYTAMPWANNRGTTTEILREIGPDGHVLLRLSVASVIEDGPFSIFPDIERNLTVISGPGFDLVGGKNTITANMLRPVAFPGDVPMTATGVTEPCDDFNVMTARFLPLPDVRVMEIGEVAAPHKGRLAVFALGAGTFAGLTMGKFDLVVTAEKARLCGGPFITVQLAF